MAFGALLIQKEYGYSDEETVLQIQENPYLQFFVGMPGYQEDKPFDASTMVHFRKRLTAEMLNEVNEEIILDFHEEEEKEEQDDNNSNDDGIPQTREH